MSLDHPSRAQTPTTARPAPLTAHAERDSLLAEAHARPFHPATSPQRFIHFGFTTSPAQAEADRAALSRFCAGHGQPGPAPRARHHRLDLPHLRLRWEQHSEFTTYTWERPEVGEPETGQRLVGMRLLPQPGPLLVAVDLRLTRSVEGDLEDEFDPSSLAMAQLDSGAALAATDFCQDAEGFIRMRVIDQGLSPIRAGALVQRLLEMETYRMFALLGLAEAHRLSAKVTAIEAELARIAVVMTEDHSLAGNHDLLQRLTALAAQLEAGATKSSYRFAASRAYADIVQGRLEVIEETPCPGHSTFASFMARRLGPAMRTCVTMEDRQANLTQQLSRAAQLLRTRVDIELEHQNRDLLSSMNMRTRLQLRLQQTVEALSVAAASYYVVALIGRALVAAPRFGLAIDVDLTTAATIPFVVAAITGLFVFRLRGEPH